ncbi:peptide chain release factor subunit 3 [Acrasis kona]|uniref:Peptide chain release factor subunit 3 n=1 Tax=Acrasis kona TaxID=1008807 RepID=A0AAW2ZM97_9EUKA
MSAEEAQIEAVTDGVKKLKFDDREHYNVVFIGHVDAGKSTLAGQILYITGMVDQRTIEKYEREAKEKNRESWFLAFIMDCGEDEREKGKTVEVGRAHFETEAHRYTILDAPGHRGYVPNMIGGASQADIGVLVISARKGEFEAGFDKGGQTREHATLAKTLGIDRLIIVINKMDEPTVKWAQERFDQIVKDLSQFLKGLGYDMKKNVQFIPIAGLTGVNIKDPLSPEICPWYKGHSLIQALDNIPSLNRKQEGALRVPIIDKYKDRGITVVLGKVESGTITKGQKVVLMPNRVTTEVVSLKCHEEEVEWCKPGENVSIYLKCDDEDIHSGHVLCNTENPCEPIQEFIGQFIVLDKNMLAPGYTAMMHIHTAIEHFKIKTIISKIDRKTGKPLPDKVFSAKSKDIIEARFEMERPICVEKFETLSAMGRFTVRESKTIGVGKVLKVKPLKSSISSNN